MSGSLITWVIIGGVALMNVVAIIAYLVVGRRQTVVEERLGQITSRQAAAPPPPIQAGRRASPFGQALEQALAGRDFAERIRRELARADLKLTVGEYLALIILAGFFFFGVGWLIFGRSLFFGALAGIFGMFVPRMYVGAQQRKRLRQFENQLGDMLNLVVNGLRAGYSSMQALESVGRELPPPISVEFHRVVQEIQLGLPQEAALANLTRRVPSADLDFVVTAINVQREVGGNLAEILDNISYTIRERVRIKGEIATLTAQGQITAWVISLLPIILALVLFLINREYMMYFFGPPIIFGVPLCGISMILTALIMIATGFAIVQKIVDIEI